jgi:hypothetical protein
MPSYLHYITSALHMNAFIQTTAQQSFQRNSKMCCWRCPAVPFPPRAGSLDQDVDDVDAPASYSSAQKISWAPIHELPHSLPMFQNLCFIFPAGILHWVIFPFYQVLKVLFSPGLPSNSFIQYALHLRFLCNW